MTTYPDVRPLADAVRTQPLRGLDAETVDSWQALADRALEPSPFAGPGVALAAARHLPGGADALLLTVERDGDLTFALPVARTRAGARFPVPTLTAWQAYYPPLATPLLDPDHAVDAWGRVRDALAHGPLRAAWLRLDPMPVDGPVAHALARAYGLAGLPAPAGEASGRPEGAQARTEHTGAPTGWFRPGPLVLDTARRAMAYPDGDHVRPSAKTRKSLESRRRKLGRLAGADAETFRVAPGDPLPDGLVRDFLALEASGWKGREGTALAGRADTAAFFTDLVRAHAARGDLEIVGIRCGDRLVAATVNLVAGRGLFFYKIAYDEEFHTTSPGRILMADNLDAFAGQSSLDFADSCADPGASLSNQVLHDRRTVGTVLVPAPSGTAGAAARSALAFRAARRRLRGLRRSRDVRGPDRSGEGPA